MELKGMIYLVEFKCVPKLARIGRINPNFAIRSTFVAELLPLYCIRKY